MNAVEDFMEALHSVTDPERKRKIIGEKFIRIFEREAKRLGSDAKFLVQGTIYPDVVEIERQGTRTSGEDQNASQRGRLARRFIF